MSDLVRRVGDPAKDLDRTLAASRANLDGMFFQRDQIHNAAEFTLAAQIAADRARRLAATIGSPGFAALTTLSTSGFNLLLPSCRALVGDEPVRVGTGGDGLSVNTIAFGAAPGSGTRWDLAILEAWVAEIGAIGSADATTKTLPVAGGIGNPDLAADATYAIQDPEIAEETARRTQVRWRLRVVEGISPTLYPQGLGDPACLGRGDAASPVSGKTFAEDPHLPYSFIAGDGTGGSASAFANATGITRAIPIVAILRTAGEGGITLTGAKDLRRPIGGGAGGTLQVRGSQILVLRAGNFSIGPGSGTAGQWHQPKQGGNYGFYPGWLPGTTDDTPLTGAFPFFPATDFKPGVGYKLKGRLYGVAFRTADYDGGGDTGAHQFGFRLRRPGQSYGQSVSSGIWTLGPVGGSTAAYTRIEDHIPAFDIPVDGTGEGLWVVELFCDAAGPNSWESAGVWLHVYAEQS